MDIFLFFKYGYGKLDNSNRSSVDRPTKNNFKANFFMGGISAVVAVNFTNPMDVIKTRQQLHGELIKCGLEGPNPYSNILQSAKTIIKSDGLLGMQRGLVPAVAYQFVLNSSRLGLYEMGEYYGILRNNDNSLLTNSVVSIFWGGACGMFGSALGYPFYMVKTQLQSTASGKVKVGFQHGHEGTIHAFQTIYERHGVQGLYHGAPGAMLRSAVGTSIQLPTFVCSKKFIGKYDVRCSKILFFCPLFVPVC